MCGCWDREKGGRGGEGGGYCGRGWWEEERGRGGRGGGGVSESCDGVAPAAPAGRLPCEGGGELESPDVMRTATHRRAPLAAAGRVLDVAPAPPAGRLPCGGELESPDVMFAATRRRCRPSSGGGGGAECLSRRSGRLLAVRGGGRGAGVSKCDAPQPVAAAAHPAAAAGGDRCRSRRSGRHLAVPGSLSLEMGCAKQPVVAAAAIPSGAARGGG